MYSVCFPVDIKTVYLFYCMRGETHKTNFYVLFLFYIIKSGWVECKVVEKEGNQEILRVKLF